MLPESNEMSVLRIVIVIILAFVVSSIFAQTSTEQSYYIEGTVSYKYRIQTGEVKDAYNRDFKLAAKGCLWLIRTFGEDAEKVDVKYVESGTDGTNVYTVVHFLPRILRNLGDARPITNPNTGAPSIAIIPRTNAVPVDFFEFSKTNIVNPAIAQVQSGSASTDIAQLVAPIWVAYASGCYYAKAFDGLVKPVWIILDPTTEYSNTRFPSLINQENSFPRLPQKIVYFSDGVGRYAPSDDRSYEFQLSPPYQNGYTNAIYQVLTTTNVGGMFFPLRATLTMFCQANNAVNSNDLFACNIYDIRTKKVIPSTSVTDFRPFLPIGTLVTDHRLELGLPLRNPLTYASAVTNGWLIDVPRLKTTQEFRKTYSEILKRSEELRARPVRRLAIGALLLTPTLIWAGTTSGCQIWKGRKRQT
ncbi:MAG: hypothetical protein HY043_15060 [Verrucomicrobia bacterium]|nr:hypothetical protein [Verrucomicrobiota bacterium]